MSEGKVKLFVGAMVRLRNGQEREIRRYCSAGGWCRWIDNFWESRTDNGEWLVGRRSDWDVIEVLNPEDDPDLKTPNQQPVSHAVELAATDSREAPEGIPGNLRECWERCAFGFKPSPEELRALWALAGFPLPRPRTRCNECNCTGLVDGCSCVACNGSGYLPVVDAPEQDGWDNCVPMGG